MHRTQALDLITRASTEYDTIPGSYDLVDERTRAIASLVASLLDVCENRENLNRFIDEARCIRSGFHPPPNAFSSEATSVQRSLIALSFGVSLSSEESEVDRTGIHLHEEPQDAEDTVDREDPDGRKLAHTGTDKYQFFPSADSQHTDHFHSAYEDRQVDEKQEFPACQKQIVHVTPQSGLSELSDSEDYQFLQKGEGKNDSDDEDACSEFSFVFTDEEVTDQCVTCKYEGRPTKEGNDTVVWKYVPGDDDEDGSPRSRPFCTETHAPVVDLIHRLVPDYTDSATQIPSMSAKARAEKAFAETSQAVKSGTVSMATQGLKAWHDSEESRDKAREATEKALSIGREVVTAAGNGIGLGLMKLFEMQRERAVAEQAEYDQLTSCQRIARRLVEETRSGGSE